MVDRIVISKSGRVLTAFDGGGAVLCEVPIGIGTAPDGTKEREGDRRTPEGDYFVCFKNPKSRFHLSLGLNYPNAADAARALAAGAISREEAEAIDAAAREVRQPLWKTALGGEIFIHGGLGDDKADTAGCIAITDAAIEALFPMVELGTPVRILP
jgi:murein L,D-transpeptidase YafK